MPPKADINKAGWEQSEFPILCETCTSFLISCSAQVLFKRPAFPIGLGNNPFIRMVSNVHFSPSLSSSPRPLHKIVKARIWTGMRNLRASVHRLPLEPGLRHALQNDGDLPDLRQDAQRMPDVSPRPRIPPPDAGPRHRARRDERGADERHQSGVLRAEPGDQGASPVLFAAQPGHSVLLMRFLQTVAVFWE